VSARLSNVGVPPFAPTARRRGKRGDCAAIFLHKRAGGDPLAQGLPVATRRASARTADHPGQSSDLPVSSNVFRPLST
jgi:hypothetical protein